MWSAWLRSCLNLLTNTLGGSISVLGRRRVHGQWRIQRGSDGATAPFGLTVNFLKIFFALFL